MTNWIPNPDYNNADNEVVIYAIGIPVGKCAVCWMPTNGRAGNDFLCSFCKQQDEGSN